MSDDTKSFTVKISCKCGAEFYYSFASGDSYYSDARKHATELYESFREDHKECNGFLKEEEMRLD